MKQLLILIIFITSASSLAQNNSLEENKTEETNSQTQIMTMSASESKETSEMKNKLQPMKMSSKTDDDIEKQKNSQEIQKYVPQHTVNRLVNDSIHRKVSLLKPKKQ